MENRYICSGVYRCTISGVGETLKKYNPNIQIVAVKPSDSPVYQEEIRTS